MKSIKLGDFKLIEFDPITEKEIVWNKEKFLKQVKIVQTNLKKLKINSDDIIAISLPNSVMNYIISYALMNLEIPIANLFFDYREIAVKNRLKIINPKFIISTKDFSRIGYDTIKVEELLKPNEEKNDNMVDEIKLKEKLAFIHFTSGTTGMPKAVPHELKDLEGLLKSNQKVLRLSEKDNYLCTADYGWVTGFYYGFILPLFTNSKTYIVKDATGNNLLKSLKNFKRWKINKIYSSPSFLTIAIREIKRLSKNNLKVFSVGEKLKGSLRKKYLENDIEIIDTWWQTELGSITISDNNGNNNMGKILSGIDFAILQNNELIERDIESKEGELLIKRTHPSIFKGYMNSKKCKFIEDYYQTGDIVKYNENKTFEYVGRADDVIVRGGELVSPYEIEDFISKNFDIEEFFIGKTKNNRVLLFTVDKNINFEEIKNRIFNELSPIMIPDKMIIIKNIPRTYSGKIKKSEVIKEYEDI
jgi:acetyl-CoA synthetase